MRANPDNVKEATSFENNGSQKLIASDGVLPETVLI
jgi:hypothetical protein